MSYVFPGMDPYLEQPALWGSFHARLIVAIANRLQPLLDPRYLAAVESRVYVEGAQQRVPDVLVREAGPRGRNTGSELEVGPRSPDVMVVEIDELEVHESRVEIRDAYRDLKIVTVIEVLSPSNKSPGPGRESYLAKQQETLASDVHFVEIDLLRRGLHTVAVPQWRIAQLESHTYLSCVSRWPRRQRFELYPSRLRESLPEISVPLTSPDQDVLLPLPELLMQVHEEGRYARWIKYADACDPPLSADDQNWIWSLTGTTK